MEKSTILLRKTIANKGKGNFIKTTCLVYVCVWEFIVGRTGTISAAAAGTTVSAADGWFRRALATSTAAAAGTLEPGRLRRRRWPLTLHRATRARSAADRQGPDCRMRGFGVAWSWLGVSGVFPRWHNPHCPGKAGVTAGRGELSFGIRA